MITSYDRFRQRAFGATAPFDLELFRSMLTRFIREASALTGQDYGSLSLFQRMAMAQHHGIPTPLLDWSHSPYVAAYFGVSDVTNVTKDRVAFRVYAAEISGLPAGEPSPAEEQRLLEAGGALFRFIDTETFRVRRIARQSGCFTFQGFGGCLYAWSESEASNDALQMKRYEIEGERRHVLRELDLMGIRGGVLFDDLDHVAKDVVDAELTASRRSVAERP
jgi:hypothetical protein